MCTHTHPYETTTQIKSLNISSTAEGSLLPNSAIFIFLSHLPGSCSIIMQKTLWGTYSLWHLIFLLTEGEKQMGHHLYIHPEFTTRPWRGRAWICWISSSMPGACATRWKEGGSKCKTSSVLAAHPIGSECLLFSRGPSSGHSFTPGFF